MTNPALSGRNPTEFYCGGCWQWRGISLITRHKKRNKPLCSVCVEKAVERRAARL